MKFITLSVKLIFLLSTLCSGSAVIFNVSPGKEVLASKAKKVPAMDIKNYLHKVIRRYIVSVLEIIELFVRLKKIA